jgi:hypothetical protein
MSETIDELHGRLATIIEDWDRQITQSHEALANQVQTARGHLDRLSQPKSDETGTPMVQADGMPDTIAALEAQVAQLTAELQQAHSAELPMVGAPPLENSADSLDIASDSDAALAEAEEANATLQAELDVRDAKLDELNTELESLRDLAETSSEEEPGESEALAALQEAHEQALARIQELEASLAHAEEAKAASIQDAAAGIVRIEAFDAQGHKKRMGEILMELGVLDEEELKSILKAQNEEPQLRLGTLVVERGLTGEDIVAKILAAQLRLPYQDIEGMEIDAAAINAVSSHVTRLHRCMPLAKEDGVLTVAMVNPLDLIAIEDLELASQCQVAPIVSTAAQIEARLQEFYGDAD